MCVHEHLETRRVENKHLALTSAVQCFSSAVETREWRERCRDEQSHSRHEHVNITYLSMSQECLAEGLTKSPVITRTFIFMCFYCEMRCVVLCRYEHYSLACRSKMLICRDLCVRVCECVVRCGLACPSNFNNKYVDLTVCLCFFPCSSSVLSCCTFSHSPLLLSARTSCSPYGLFSHTHTLCIHLCKATHKCMQTAQ